MVKNSKESLGSGVELRPAETSGEAGRQSLLEKLAERTVLQAEALAQEITDNARLESEAEGIKVLAEYSQQAKAEAQQTIELAERRSETLRNEAIAKAHSKSEEILGKSQSEGQEILDKAQSEGQEILDKAQFEGQEILDRARQEALAIINASQARANSTESNATLKAEFIIKQTTQSVADGIRSAVMEVCNNLLPTLDELGKEVPEDAVSDHVERAAFTGTEIPRDASSNGTEENHSPPYPARTDAQSSDRPSARKAKSSARTNEQRGG